ncbi:NUDIX hydrolase [Oceanobacillus polygoni]|uniref:Aminoglycoside 6'-N-acetyltransferase n=1 Tax=Oceanobacillus polygoni TaxID=1235259 RepID=A0A9X0YU73_9BACI|nr:NUDIX hydrolase [Oceanobacillus polygoni]MBP2078798.1 aminoglycoside 6'-N-acetyltransferase [Oceanobacillus polygoni]
MEKWFGSSGVCINEEGQLLMILQGKPEEKKAWSVPSGGKEKNESFQACCIREVEEETGYMVEVVDKIKQKKGSYKENNISFEVHYFLVRIIGGERKIQDPDNLIYDIAWKDVEELKTIDLSFPEDRDFLISYMKNYCTQLGERLNTK